MAKFTLYGEISLTAKHNIIRSLGICMIILPNISTVRAIQTLRLPEACHIDSPSNPNHLFGPHRQSEQKKEAFLASAMYS